MRYLRTIDPKRLVGRVALVRLDFNTEDEWRMAACLPTVEKLIRSGATVVIASHRGRPKGVEPELSLRPDALKLAELLGRPISFIPHLRFASLRGAIRQAPPRSIFLLENLRFLPGEEKNSPVLAKQLASLADIYVNDAFAVSHRKAASVVAIAKFLPSYVGLELEQEIAHLSHVMGHPHSPVIVVVGGGKAHDKLGVLDFFRHRADAFIVGGASANTLLKIQGKAVGRSLVDDDPVDRPMLQKILTYPHLYLPVDWREKEGRILDIGPKTETIFRKLIKDARTIVWSGPMGYIESARFERGNLAVARAIAGNKRAFTLTGGGETVMFLKKHKLDKKFKFISTGGGAMLEYLAGEKLPGIEALK